MNVLKRIQLTATASVGNSNLSQGEKDQPLKSSEQGYDQTQNINVDTQLGPIQHDNPFDLPQDTETMLDPESYWKRVNLQNNGTHNARDKGLNSSDLNNTSSEEDDPLSMQSSEEYKHDHLFSSWSSMVSSITSTSDHGDPKVSISLSKPTFEWNHPVSATNISDTTLDHIVKPAVQNWPRTTKGDQFMLASALPHQQDIDMSHVITEEASEQDALNLSMEIEFWPRTTPNPSEMDENSSSVTDNQLKALAVRRGIDEVHEFQMPIEVPLPQRHPSIIRALLGTDVAHVSNRQISSSETSDNIPLSSSPQSLHPFHVTSDLHHSSDQFDHFTPDYFFSNRSNPMPGSLDYFVPSNVMNESSSILDIDDSIQSQVMSTSQSDFPSQSPNSSSAIRLLPSPPHLRKNSLTDNRHKREPTKKSNPNSSILLTTPSLVKKRVSIATKEGIFSPGQAYRISAPPNHPHWLRQLENAKQDINNPLKKMMEIGKDHIKEDHLDEEDIGPLDGTMHASSFSDTNIDSVIGSVVDDSVTWNSRSESNFSQSAGDWQSTIGNEVSLGINHQSTESWPKVHSNLLLLGNSQDGNELQEPNARQEFPSLDKQLGSTWPASSGLQPAFTVPLPQTPHSVPITSSTTQSSKLLQSISSRVEEPFYVYEQVKTPKSTMRGRPHRTRMPPLEFWRNERVVYGHKKDDPLPSLIGVIRNTSLPTPIRPSKRQRRLQTNTMTTTPTTSMAKNSDTNSSTNSIMSNNILLVQDTRTNQKSLRALAIQDPRWRMIHPNNPKTWISDSFGGITGWIRLMYGGSQDFMADDVQSKLFFVSRGQVTARINTSLTKVPSGGTLLIPPGKSFTLINTSKGYVPCIVAFVALPGDLPLSNEANRPSLISVPTEDHLQDQTVHTPSATMIKPSDVDLEQAVHH